MSSAKLDTRWAMRLEKTIPEDIARYLYQAFLMANSSGTICPKKLNALLYTNAR
jgi:hypothetical protein